MKTFIYAAETTFLLLGTIIGSGFISGREIVSFFGGNICFFAFFAGVLFFFTTYLLLRLGGRYGTFEESNRALFGRAHKTVGWATAVCLFTVVASSLAMTDSMMNSLFGIDGRIPAASLLTLAVAFISARRGLDGVKKLNAVLVPLMLALTTVFLFVKGDFDFGAPAYPAESNVFSVCFYVGFNMFLSAAVIVRAGDGNRKHALLTAAISGAVTAVFIVLIYGAVNYEGINAAEADLPLAALFSYSAFMSAAFGAVLYAGALTTVVCSYYPLSEAVSRKSRMFSVTLAVGVFLFSRIGVKTIVGAAYPAAGVLGALYFIYAAVVSAYKNKPFGKIKNKEKNKEKENAEKKEKDKSSPPFRRGLQ
ncbi:MAG: hypothetical protein ACLUHK_08740 [Eubacteriales bacterium]